MADGSQSPEQSPGPIGGPPTESPPHNMTEQPAASILPTRSRKSFLGSILDRFKSKPTKAASEQPVQSTLVQPPEASQNPSVLSNIGPTVEESDQTAPISPSEPPGSTGQKAA